MNERTPRLRLRILICIAIAFIGIAIFAIGLTTWALRSDAVTDAVSDAGNIATVLAEQTARSVQSIDLILTEVQDHVTHLAASAPDKSRQTLDGEHVHHFLKERLSRLPQADIIALIDDVGLLANGSRSWPIPYLDLSDREYFKHHKEHKSKNIYIGSPVANRSTGVQTVFFSKRIDDADGNFLGMVSVGIKLDYFRHIYESITSLRNQSFLFLRRDGTVLVRYPDPKDRAGEKMPATSPWYTLVSRGGGNYRSPGYFDNAARLVAVRPLREYPLVVNVAISEVAALANWRSRATFIGIGTLLAVVCSVFLLLALIRQLRRLMESELSLAENSRKLAQANAQLDAALNNMRQGLLMFDSESRLIVCNQRYLQIYGLSPETIKPGCTLRDIFQQRAATGTFNEDPDQYIAGLGGGGNVATKVVELPDGRAISVTNNPTPNAGWVSTHDDVTERRRAEAQIAYMAHYDTLTGLPNRAYFCEELDRALARVQRGGRIALLYLDLDHFKRANDTLGHFAGDELLKAVADRLRGCVRETDFIARLGGDEFAVIQTALEGSNPATLAARISEALKAPFDHNDRKIVVGVSIGISIAPDDAIERERLLKNADLALYEAKDGGRGTYCFYEPELNARMRARQQLEEDLRYALINGEFELHYQPIVDLQTNHVSSCEALLRWRHPERGMVPRSEFIPIAEESGLITALGEWALRRACADAATWPDDIKVAVNISPAQLAGGKLLDVVVNALAASGIPARRLELEVTETALTQNTFASLATLHRLRALGLRIAMDDFGTGYSSLSYLRSFPFDSIKIDRSFIEGISEKDACFAIVRAITNMAKHLNMTTTAEGVDTEEQREKARELGCTEMQGYLFSRPRRVDEILPILQRNAQIALTRRKLFA